MRLRALLPTLLALPLLLVALAVAAPGRQALDPTRLPGLPGEPPPPLSAGPGAPSVARARFPRHQMTASAGWQMVSFPVSRLEAVGGLPRMLLSRGPSGLVAVDPVNHPDQVDTGLAYLAWFDQPGVIEYAGPDTPEPGQTTTLYAGWNLVGCPSSQPILRETLTVTRAGGATMRPQQVASPEAMPGTAWLYSTVHAFVGGQWRQGDLRQPGRMLEPGQVAVVFSWQELELNWNQVPPTGGAPFLKGATPPAANPGQTVVLTGQNLGQPGFGQLNLGSQPVQPEDILAWSPTQVKFRVPPGFSSGSLQVMVNRFPGNSLALTVKPPQPKAPAYQAATGSLIGQVVSSDGSPLRGAQIQLDDGQSALSDALGTFRLDNLPVGAMQAYITLAGFKSARGQVQVAAGTARTLQVSLSPTSGDEVGARSAEQTGNFTLTAYPFAVGQEQRNRYWVYRIEAWEYGNYRRRWEKTWWTDVGDASFDLPVSGALMGRSYAVIVTWRNRAGDERTCRWTPEFTSDGQTFRYYNPLGSSG